MPKTQEITYLLKTEDGISAQLEKTGEALSLIHQDLVQARNLIEKAQKEVESLGDKILEAVKKSLCMEPTEKD
jgi:hypothetical protein